MKEASSSRASLFYALLFYFVGALVCYYLHISEYNIDTDTVSYIGLAQKFLRGDFWDGVTSYWGPLTSWLLLPFYAIGLAPLRGTSALAVTMGFGALLGIWRVSSILKMSRNFRVATLFPASFMLWYMRYRVSDLVLLVPILFYLSEIFRDNFFASRRNAVLAGAWGGIAFLAKSYAFPFFLIHFTLFSYFHKRRSPPQSKKTSIKYYLFGIATWACFTIPWILTIHAKYGRFTIGDAGQFTINMLNPDGASGREGDLVAGFGELPALQLGFLRPPGKIAGIYSWEEPIIEGGRTRPWSPFHSMRYFKRAVGLVLKNAYTIYNFYLDFSGFVVLLLLIGLAESLQPLQKILNHPSLFFLFSTILLYPLGYLPLVVMERYLWLVWILFLLQTGICLGKISELFSLNAWQRRAVIIVFLGSFLLLPVKSLVKFRNSGRNLHDTAKLISARCGVKGNIGSNLNWEETLFMTLALPGHYYGMPRPGEEPNAIEQDLKTQNTDYFFLWDPVHESKNYSFLQSHPKLSIERKKDFPSNLEIFSLHDEDGKKFQTCLN